MQESFYSDLQSFSQFEEIAEDQHYAPAPENWCIVVSTVVDPSALIENHRYRDVNTVGAATIVAVKNAIQDVDIPYVFGGDEAILLIPETRRDSVSRNLDALRQIARKRFQMEMRIAIVPIRDLLAEETSIEVAKLRMIGDQSVALLRGEGIPLAREMGKKSPTNYEIENSHCTSVDLEGLSCRWHEIPNQHGFILSLQVKARKENANRVYADLIAKLTSIFAGVLDDANPVNPSLMTYRSTSELVVHEKRLVKPFSMSWLKRHLEIFAAIIIFKWRLIPQFLFRSDTYQSSMRSHADYRHFDNTFRMILDCTPQQVMELSEYLDNAHEREELYYGIHQSQTSLMTCFVQGLGTGEHVHFIDGGDGGYAMASRKLEEQMEKS